MARTAAADEACPANNYKSTIIRRLENFYRVTRKAFFIVAFIVAGFCVNGEVNAQQSNSYELLPAPDVWYNDVDGIRVGLRLRGQMKDSFNEGPHRLDAGVWLGTWIPDYPVSYYISLTEPIPAISDFGSEGNIRLESSIRTGFHRHGASFNKRWQTGFEEQHYTELSIGAHMEDRFESEYLQFPQLWTEETYYLASLNLDYQNEHSLGPYNFAIRNTANVAGESSFFVNSSAELQQKIPINDSFSFRGRLFAGIGSDDTPVHHRYPRSFKTARGWMESGLTRAKGTIRSAWMDNGVFQLAGGGNLRGYLNKDIEQLNDGGLAPVSQSLGAVNAELAFPNPIDNAIRNIPVVGELMELRSYSFFDAGSTLGVGSQEEQDVLADAGLGLLLSINIPDYLGKSRGLTFRYDVPMWLSDPADEPAFKYRNVIGIGAVISL